MNKIEVYPSYWSCVIAFALVLLTIVPFFMTIGADWGIGPGFIGGMLGYFLFYIVVDSILWRRWTRKHWGY